MIVYSQPRRGFTLVELLVVMFIIAALAAMLVAFLPSAINLQREARAAQLLQGWLNIAKQRALRDQAPRGLRLTVGPSAWSSSTFYIANDLVNNGGINYLCIASNNNQPPPNVACWSPLTITSLTAWNGSSTYVAGNLVLYGGVTFLCIAPNTNQQPPNTAYWSLWNLVTNCQNIEQPDDFNSGQIKSGAANNIILFSTGDLLNGNYPLNPADVAYWAVQPGDYLEILGTGLMYQIQPVGGVGVLNNTFSVIQPYNNYVVLDRALPYPLTTATSNYRILRAPRAVGTEPLQLPPGTVIDVNTNVAFVNPLPGVFGSYYDILFAPSGAVISRGTSTSNLNLWVRAPSEDSDFTAYVYYPANNKGFPLGSPTGNPTIVSVSVRTGFVGAYSPIPWLPANPYGIVQQ